MGKKSRASAQRIAARTARHGAQPMETPRTPATLVVGDPSTAHDHINLTQAIADLAESGATPPPPSATAAGLDAIVASLETLLALDAEEGKPRSASLGTQAADPASLRHAAAIASPTLVSAAVADDEPFEMLSTILFGEYRQQIVQMRQQVTDLQRLLDALEVQINDEEALISTITPVIASAIRTNITDSRDEMIDALYPIMGKLVQRSVTEAMRDLARRIDEQMRRTFNVQALWRQMLVRMRGVSQAEMALRDAFPFHVLQVFLIHRETGLLLMHCAQQTEETTDSDLISSMLTAIRDFTEDAFGRGQEAELNEIQYGERSILIEVAHMVYIAVVIEGVLRSGFREQMREMMITIEHQHATALRTYDGDASRFTSADAALRTLLLTT